MATLRQFLHAFAVMAVSIPSLSFAAGTPRPGYYECWYWRSVYSPNGYTGELQLSSMGWLRLNVDGTYQTGLNPTVPLAKAEHIDTKGRWSFDGKQFSWKGGWMENVRSSKLVENGKDQQVVLPRDENKQNGKPLIDTNDTKCTWKKA